MIFEKLEIWKRACKLSESIYKECKQVRDYGFKDKITRSGLSVPSNIVEGVESESLKEQIHFLNIAKGSLAELKTQMIIGKSIGYLNQYFVREWLEHVNLLSAMLGALIKKKKSDLTQSPVPSNPNTFL